VHFSLGNLAYGTSPGKGNVHLTLRSYRNDDMHSLKKELETLVKRIAGKEKLTFNIAYEEVFPATINNPLCSQIVKNACDNDHLKNTFINNPFKWSEDFGHFTEKYPGALIGLGSGVSQPALHNPDFDFPDDLIQTGVGLFKRIYESILNHD
jgi:metal-dependent amidase/aminoacylase/carboxypeptidase family protein